jgi:ankyrin repeat protein
MRKPGLGLRRTLTSSESAKDIRSAPAPAPLVLSFSMGSMAERPKKKTSDIVDIAMVIGTRMLKENREFYENLDPNLETKDYELLEENKDSKKLTYSMIEAKDEGELAHKDIRVLLYAGHGSVGESVHRVEGLAHNPHDDNSTSGFLKRREFERHNSVVEHILSCEAQGVVVNLTHKPNGYILITHAPADKSGQIAIHQHHTKILIENYTENLAKYRDKETSKAYIAVSQFAKLIASSPQYIAFNIMVDGEMKTFESQLPKDKAVSTEEEIKRHIGNMQICFGEFLLKHEIMDIIGVNEIITRPLLPKQNIKTDIDQYKKDTLLIYCRYGFKGNIVATFLSNNTTLLNEPLNNRGYTALMLASRSNDKAMVELLLNSGADINQQNFYGDTALTHAVKEGSADSVKTLLDHGANLAITSARGKPITYYINNNPDMVQPFIEYFFEKVNEHGGQSDDKEREVIKAKIEALLGIVNVVNATYGKYRNTALMEVSMLNDKAMVELLLNSGAKINQRNIHGYTALIHAVNNGSADSVKTLLDHGANLTITSARGKPITYYIENNLDMVQPFTEYFFEKVNEHGGQSDDKEREVIKAKIEALLGTVNVVNATYGKYRDTALMMVSRSNDKAMVELLLNSRAKINQQDINGYTALIHAVKEGSADSVKTLLDHGANLTITSSRGKPITYYINGNADIEQILFDYFAELVGSMGDGDKVSQQTLTTEIDINCQDKDSKTAMKDASCKLETIKLILGYAVATKTPEKLKAILSTEVSCADGMMELLDLISLKAGADKEVATLLGETKSKIDSVKLPVEKDWTYLIEQRRNKKLLPCSGMAPCP